MPQDQGFAAMARLLDVLASPVRLAILHAVREPSAIGDIRVAAARSRRGEQEGRPLARQTVSHHIDQLREAGLLRSITTPQGAEGVVLDHARLFALVDEIRAISKLRPTIPASTSGLTVVASADAAASIPAPPRLAVAYGRDDGVAYALHGPVGSRWRLGRGARCEIRLDYDPYASSEHAVVHRTREGFEVSDVGARNGTWLDWQRLPRNGSMPLVAGSLLAVGRSILVFQAGPVGGRRPESAHPQ